MPTKKINLRDRLEDDQLDLSMSDLDEVPVREIAQIKKATALDLSNNRLTSLGRNFASLTHLIKLDLSKNFLTELPDNFGDLVLLKHLDLYSNKLQHLPLSLGNLRNLRWLDLKNNPLVPALAEVVGPCLDAAQCQKAARKVVPFLQIMQERIAEERERRQQQRKRQKELDELAALEKKKELLQQQQQQKKKKKNSKAADKVQSKPEDGMKQQVNAGNGRAEGVNVKKTTVESNNKPEWWKLPNKKGSSYGIFTKIWNLIFVVTACVFGMSLVSLVSPERYLFFQQSVRNVMYPPAAELLWQMIDFVSEGIQLSIVYGKAVWVWLQTNESLQEFVANVISVWHMLCIKIEESYRTLSHQMPVYIDMVKKKIL